MICVVTGEVAVVGVTTAVSRVPAPHPQFSQQPTWGTGQCRLNTPVPVIRSLQSDKKVSLCSEIIIGLVKLSVMLVTNSISYSLHIVEH